MRKLLLVDLNILGSKGGGHSEFYFMNILSILSREYDIVYACCGNNQRLRENIEQENLKNCQVIDIDVNLSDKIIRRLLLLVDRFLHKIPQANHIQFSSLINLTIVKRLLANIGEEIPVFFPYIDSIIPAVPRFISRFFFPKKWSGLEIIPSYQLKIMDGIEKSRIRFYAEKNFLLPSCQSILVLHPLYQRFFNKRFPGLTCLYLPELVDFNPISKDEINNNINRELLSQIKNHAQGRKIISILGNLTPRKNLPLFLESVTKLSPNKYFILVLGTIKAKKSISVELDIEKVNNYIELLHKNSYINTNYYITNEAEFSDLIKLSDIVFCHYKSYPFSSSILTKVMAHCKPVIVDKGYLMEKILNKYNWKIATSGDYRSIADAIEHLIDTNYQVESSSYRKFIEDHSIEKFQSVIIQTCNIFYI